MEISDHYFYENQARNNGYKLIAGGDEAGRGPWAGPVFAAMVILPDDHRIEGLNDSKKLSKKKRKQLYSQIVDHARAISIGTASAEEIDNINILQATRLAFQRAFTNLCHKPDYLLLDYIKLPWLQLPHQAFAKGESVSASVAAASIVAKEARDEFMLKLADQFPGYGFEKHMGYGTAAHKKALETLGPCHIHRKSFKPIKKLLPDKPQYETLFDF
ncbi:MAG: ribonuclease HII [Candidatus Rifleibacteriota bacterium]